MWRTRRSSRSDSYGFSSRGESGPPWDRILSVDPLVKSGYQFTMAGTSVTDAGLTCTGGMPVESYRLTADPLKPGVSGSRFFATNTDRVVYEDVEKTFGTDMPEKGPPTHGLELK